MNMTPEEIYRKFEHNANSYIAAEQEYLTILKPPMSDIAKAKISAVELQKKTLKEICGVK